MPTPESDTRPSEATARISKDQSTSPESYTPEPYTKPNPRIPKNRSPFRISLREWQNLSADEREPGYLFVRCAGLYLGFLTYMGTQGLGKRLTEYYTSAIPILSVVAAQARVSHRGGTLQQYFEQVIVDQELIAQIYRTRMRRNYAESGQALADDWLMNSDLVVCKETTEFADRLLNQ